MARVQALSPDQQTQPAVGAVAAPEAREAIDFADFFENAAVALHVVGPDGTILHANRAELELLDYAPEDYVGRNIVDVHADREVIEDILARLSRGETLSKYPARLVARDGSLRHVEITSNVQFRDGAFIGTRCITVDVTELVQAREEVRRKDEQLRGILDALPTAVYTTDATGTITYANRAAADLAGRQPDIGKDKWCVSFRLFTPEGQELAHDACPMAVALKENRAVRGVELLAERPDGSRVALMPFPTPLRDADGRLVGAVNMLVDISERKQAEEELRRSREFKRRILESTRDCIKVLDLDGRILSINDSGLRTLGVDSASAIEGARYVDLWQDEDRAAAEVALAAALAGGIGRFTAPYAAPSGATSWWDEVVTPILGAGGKPDKLLVVSRDITEIKAAYEQREVLIEELDHRVKNSLATVQSLASATLPASPELETYFGRLRALAEAHRLLADTRWDGGCLESIVTTILTPYSERARTAGGGVRLTPRAAQTMCMVINELATNAVKYGALSQSDGRVDVSWSVSRDGDEAALTLSWVEVGGPPVAEPTRKGFGTKLIVQAVEYELRGRTELSFAPDGLRCRIEMPWHGNIRKTKSPDCA